jgi:hypothetical protein
MSKYLINRFEVIVAEYHRKMTKLIRNNASKMCDWNFVFESDFLIETMYNIVSPFDLYKFRHINTTIYNTITSDRIYKKITELICVSLEKLFGEKYQEFLDIMKKRNIQIYGPFINEIIWEEIPEDSCLWLRMLEKDIGNKEDNVLADYAKINSDYKYTAGMYESLSRRSYYGSSNKVLKLSNNIKLQVISSETFVKYDTYPEIFQNNVNFVNDKFTLFLKYETMVMTKIQITSLEAQARYLCSHDEIIYLCKKYNIKLECSPLFYYLVDGDEDVVPVVVCDGDQIALLGKRFTNNSKEHIVSDPFTIKIREKEYDIYVNTKRTDFFYGCRDIRCPINKLAFILKVKHFHSHTILTHCSDKYLLPPANTKGVREYSDKTQLEKYLLHPANTKGVREYSDNIQLEKYFSKLIVFEYQNVEFFKNYKNIFDINYNKTPTVDIDFGTLDKLRFFEEKIVSSYM